ncbi:uncharacterized protein LOC135924126 [Gordionus sp. m RMFG-2023]|uniref:uncharacterized protein LOC135924126 n=1 Tax=Gordionus sp. m RMFG-2023 TaxID=3053472 RepID=UPI0031FE22C7
MEYIKVTDNDTNFTSNNFEKFCNDYGIKHVLTSAYHQQSNHQLKVTDNGTNFTSNDFEKFCNDYGIKHVLTSAYQQQYDQVERMVRTFKTYMKRNTNIDLDTAFDKFLFNYRNMCNDTTKVTPSKKMFNRDMRVKWDLLKPLVEKENKINVTLPRNRTFNLGDFVCYKVQGDDKWWKGVVTHKESDTIFQILKI